MDQDSKEVGERRAFRMHKDLLWSVVQSQAGTLSKALLECVMNSTDAGSTFCKIDLTRETVKIADDGKGFASRTEIEEFFEQFGTPHKKGDAVFGKFRMGRGQLMSFTENTWRSGNFSMFVNLQELGLEYVLNTLPEAVQGCTIDCVLYEKLEPSAVIRLVDELRTLCKYAPIPVYVNGERISKDLSTIKWTDEDEFAYYQVRESGRSMEVFNKGVHVRDFWRGEFGVCGLVVTKQGLEVNFARNDVLANKCPVFKHIAAKLKTYAKKNESTKPRNNEAYREMMMDKLLTGSFDSKDEFVDAVITAKVVTDYSGKHFSLMDLTHQVQKCGGALVSAEEHSIKADKVQQAKLAVVVDPKTMLRAQNLTMAEIVERVEQNYKTFCENGRDGGTVHYVLEQLKAAMADLDVVGALMDESMKIIEPAEYTKEERLVLGVLQTMSGYFTRATGQREARRIGIIESESYDGITDGKRMVFLERKFLKIGGAAGNVFKAFDSLKTLMVHEYLHDQDDSSGHGHPAEFYERFHDIVSNDHGMRIFTYEATRQYLAARRKAGAKMRAGDLHTLDTILIEDIGAIKGATEKDWIDAKASIGSATQASELLDDEPATMLED